jgi:hypothetical protein
MLVGYDPGFVREDPSPSWTGLPLSRGSYIGRTCRILLSDSFPFVILWIQAFVRNVWEFACSILLWSCDLTEVSFIHSPSSSRPCPSRRNQSAVTVDVIGPFWCGMNKPSSFLVFWIRIWLREGQSWLLTIRCECMNRALWGGII